MLLAPLWCEQRLYAQDSLAVDSIQRVIDDTPAKKHRGFFPTVGHAIVDFVNKMSDCDTTYIEPNHYKFQAMMLNTNTFETFIYSSEGKSMRFSPKMRTRVGPYVGYSLVFLGMNLQFNQLYVGDYKQEFDMSVYTPMMVLDVFYRDNGSDFDIASMNLGADIDTRCFRGRPYSGFSSMQKGFNLYYIFNHLQHSYPAAYNQSTRQKRSAGSPIIGVGWSRHSSSVDWKALNTMVASVYPDITEAFSTEITYDNISYDCYQVYGGYSYNWVPMSNFLVGASLSLGVAYNRTHLANGKSRPLTINSLRNVTATDFSLDGCGRVGMVYNNDRFFVGTSMIFHSYSYRSHGFSTNDIFGSLNAYVGINFGAKKKYRKPGRFFQL